MKNKIRIICAVAASISIFLITCFLGLLLVRIALGNTTYAVKIPLLIPLCAIAAILTGNIFSFDTEVNDEYEEDEPTEEHEDLISHENYTPPQLDESLYPELFSQGPKEESSISFKRPNIKQILREQFKEAEISSESSPIVKTNEDPVFSFSNPEKESADIYSDIPKELPGDYVAYDYEEEDDDEVFDDEESYTPRIPRVILRITAALIAVIAAIFIPINCATVYSPDSITVRRLFAEKHYSLTDADYYTIGVDLTGDISMKLHFKNGKEFSLLVPETAIKSGSFKNNFSSKYAFAAFCNRLLERENVEKRFEDLVSLSPSDALSQKDFAYIEEITETNLTN